MEIHELVVEMKLLERRLTLYEEKYGILSEDFHAALLAGKLARSVEILAQDAVLLLVECEPALQQLHLHHQFVNFHAGSVAFGGRGVNRHIRSVQRSPPGFD